MSNKKVIPSIHIPIQRPDGSMEWVWYMFFQWLSDNFGNYFTKEEITEMLGDYFTKEEITEMLGDYFTKDEINEMLSDYALDENVVHKTGNETIADQKTFTGTSNSWELPICIKNTNSHAIADQVPTGSTGKGISFVDKNGVLDGYVEFYRDQSVGYRYLALSVTKNNQFYSSIVIGFNSNDDLYTSTPTPPVGSWDSFIANTEWVQNPDYSTNVVHRSGNENIAGVKEFTTAWGTKVNRVIYSRGSEAYNGTTSGWTLEGGIHIIGPNDGEPYGAFETIKDGGSTYSQMNVRGRSGNWSASPIGVGVNENEITFTFAPACDWNNSIVTTVDKSKSYNGFFKLGNGLIIQWGVSSSLGSAWDYITFPTAFSTTNYSVCATAVTDNSDINEDCFQIHGRETTRVSVSARGYNASSINKPYAWIAIGY